MSYSSPTYKKCPKCGLVAALQDRFCQNCGHGYRTQFAPQQPSPQNQTDKQPAWYMPNAPTPSWMPEPFKTVRNEMGKLPQWLQVVMFFSLLTSFFIVKESIVNYTPPTQQRKQSEMPAIPVWNSASEQAASDASDQTIVQQSQQEMALETKERSERMFREQVAKANEETAKTRAQNALSFEYAQAHSLDGSSNSYSSYHSPEGNSLKSSLRSGRYSKTSMSQRTVYVSSYTRRDGTHVRSHKRSPPGTGRSRRR
jgi:hypothetical protein